MIEGSRFLGPVFVTGMPRSGTKLLRDLLNNHSAIAIPENESMFIPKAIRTLGVDVDFSTAANFDLFWEIFRSSKLFDDQKGKGTSISRDQLKNAEHGSWSPLVRDLFLQCSPKSGVAADKLVWGDKTPGYMLHYKLLKKAFPEARFVHIIRDPRDYVCSVNNAWGRSIQRAAWRWSYSMEVCAAFSDDTESYLEVRFEDLLDNPENVLQRICGFLDLSYESGMSELKRVTENLGHAKGQRQIVKGNKGKFKEQLSDKDIDMIESLCFDQMNRLGYSILSSSKGQKRLSSMKQKVLKLNDGVRSLAFHTKERGLIAGTRYFLQVHKDNSWRKTEID